MKKMFGENGWLGKTPDEAQDAKLQSKKPSSQQKKTTMMEKIKHKLDDFVSTNQAIIQAHCPNTPSN
jgi:hypothetical protein